LKSAAKQASAAREQAQAASENIKLTREQIEQQRSLKLVEALVDFRRMQGPHQLVDASTRRKRSHWVFPGIVAQELA
jgi:hypothetical protein